MAQVAVVEFVNTTNNVGGTTVCEWFVDDVKKAETGLGNAVIPFFVAGVYTIRMVATNALQVKTITRENYITITDPVIP